MSATTCKTTSIEVSVTCHNDAYTARIGGYSAWSKGDPLIAVRRVAEKAARELCGQWAVANVALLAHVTLEGGEA